MSCYACKFPADPDLQDRDPHNTSSHIKVVFNDVIAEPKESHSPECVWESSYCCYDFFMTLCYSLFSCCCGICIAAELGCEFGGIIFCHVWYCTPGLKNLYYQMAPCRCLYAFVTRCICDPWFESCSYLFGAFEEPHEDGSPKARLF